jgi:hypothetical protein
MRKLVIKLTLFVGVMEGLGRVDFIVLLTGIGVAIAVIVCSDYLVGT